MEFRKRFKKENIHQKDFYKLSSREINKHSSKSYIELKTVVIPFPLVEICMKIY